MTETIAERYHRLAESFAQTIGAVNEHYWNQMSPCEDWSALDVMRHVIDTQSLVADMGGHQLRPGPPVGSDPLGAWISASDQIQALLEDPSAADAPFDGGSETFAQVIDQLLSFDLVVHRWDIADATGLRLELDPGDVDAVMARAQAMGDDLREEGVCGPPLEPPADADAQTRMLAFLGRQAS